MALIAKIEASYSFLSRHDWFHLLMSTKGRIVTFVNPYSYSILRGTNLSDKFDLVFIDGQALTLLARLLLKPKIVRLSFDMTSMAWDVLNYCNETQVKVYLIGSNQLNIERAAFNIRGKFDKIDLCGIRNGFFNTDEERTSAMEEIVSLNPSVVIVGMGTPIQEKFLLDLKNLGWNGIGFTCGGFLHQSSESLDYYPSIINQLHLRWLYRLIYESHSRRRFFAFYPTFAFKFLRDYLYYLRRG